MRSIPAIAATLLISAPALAQEMAPKLIEEARADIAGGNYEAGIAKLDKAYGLDPRPEIVFEVAVAYSLWQGHCQDSITYFDRFFQVCDKCDSFAAAKDRFDKVRTLCTVKVRVETEPPGAMISIDGDAIGSSPLDATIVAGNHAFEAELTGFSSPSASLSVAPGQGGAQVKLTLTPLPAFVEFQNVAPEATVVISGVPARPPKMEVQPGRHTIEASRPGFESKTIEVVARRGETATVDLTLEPERTTYRLYMWASVGVGVFSLATTAAFALMANEAKADKRMAEMFGGRQEEYIRSLESRIKSRTILAVVTGSVATLAGIAALVFYLIEPEEELAPVAVEAGTEGLLFRF
jgi:hypothetical protein